METNLAIAPSQITAKAIDTIVECLPLHNLWAQYKTHRLLREATLVCYEDAIQSVARFLGVPSHAVDLNDLTVDVLLAHRHWCLQTMRGVSYNKHRRHLRALLNFAVRMKWLRTSPLCEVGSAPTGARQPKTVTPNWLKSALAKIETSERFDPKWFWVIVTELFYFTGMRRRQLVMLKWRDVNVRNSTLVLSSEGSKNHKSWEVPIPRWLSIKLQDLKQRTEIAMGRCPQPDDQVFNLPLHSARTYKKQSLCVAHIDSFFSKLSKGLGYAISSHRVRHTMATLLLSRSGDLKAVSAMLGHSSVSFTADTYTHVSVASLRKATRRLPHYVI